jgi:putative AdoMet-dependent methyltransferase
MTLGVYRQGDTSVAQEGSVNEFDVWAASYDLDVGAADGFPFAGYHAVLDAVVAMAKAEPGMAILELGIGTGNLALRFQALGCDVWGVDSSAAMLAKAVVKVPAAHLALADLTGDWPDDFDRRYERIVSSYTLHHLTLPAKVALLSRLAAMHLAPGGRVVVADVAFANRCALAAARRRWQEQWDEEDYWVADEAAEALLAAGLVSRYRQVSCCAGVFVVAAS